MKKLIVLFSIIFGATFSSSLKAEGPCRADIQKFCSEVKPGGGRLLKCLNENKAGLSSGCKAAHAEMEGLMFEAQEACREDGEKLCEGLKSGEGRMFKCLKENEAKLSETCKSSLASGKERRKMRRLKK